MSRKQLRRLESEIVRLHNLFVDDEGEWLGGVAVASNMAEIRSTLQQAMKVRAEVMEHYRKLGLLEQEEARVRAEYKNAHTHKQCEQVHYEALAAHRAVSAYREAHDL